MAYGGRTPNSFGLGAQPASGRNLITRELLRGGARQPPTLPQSQAVSPPIMPQQPPVMPPVMPQQPPVMQPPMPVPTPPQHILKPLPGTPLGQMGQPAQPYTGTPIGNLINEGTPDNFGTPPLQSPPAFGGNLSLPQAQQTPPMGGIYQGTT